MCFCFGGCCFPDPPPAYGRLGPGSRSLEDALRMLLKAAPTIPWIFVVMLWLFFGICFGLVFSMCFCFGSCCFPDPPPAYGRLGPGSRSLEDALRMCLEAAPTIPWLRVVMLWLLFRIFFGLVFSMFFFVFGKLLFPRPPRPLTAAWAHAASH